MWAILENFNIQPHTSTLHPTMSHQYVISHNALSRTMAHSWLSSSSFLFPLFLGVWILYVWCSCQVRSSPRTGLAAWKVWEALHVYLCQSTKSSNEDRGVLGGYMFHHVAFQSLWCWPHNHVSSWNILLFAYWWYVIIITNLQQHQKINAEAVCKVCCLCKVHWTHKVCCPCKVCGLHKVHHYMLLKNSLHPPEFWEGWHHDTPV